ncbi:MAG: class I SAM-dependent DNA methyltransferase [Rhizobiaceae bacterium]|nr:class I SAM-dependent DNA methyltransferase [Rhizobiaceae bacterium]MCV0405760.1 class I SAM-dependent DNA methyltransferase [Rhizobiaceae bacterium]
MRMEVEAFIARWKAGEGGAERANSQLFIAELCDVIGVPRPEPADAGREGNDYVFERAVRRRESDAVASWRRIDLYRKGCFILEAKQSRMPGGRKALPAQLSLPMEAAEAQARRGVGPGWDALMRNARKQAQDYVQLLDPDHPAPPFIIVCDVAHAFEIYADFTGTGRAYGMYPDRKSFRFYLEDLRDQAVRDLFAAVWMDPWSLDPAKETARVTREIAARLAAVSRSLERTCEPEVAALFLMRCIFCMFAEDVDLLPKGEFTRLLEDCVKSPGALVPLLEELWSRMDQRSENDRFFSYFAQRVRYFNGNLYRDARALRLDREDIGELVAAARHRWIDVDPAIFGTLLEQALDPVERRKLGAHYTPRVYVERLVEVTVMEPLRDDWQKALKQAEDAKDRGDERGAVGLVRSFHRRLCATRVLDPACGTGNFLYVSLEMMKRLEGEVLETLARLGATEDLGLERETVDPHQFLGLERNPRAAAIAELVVWIGYLQQHYRTRTGHPAEPVLRAFANINFGRRDGYDAVLTWDGYPATTVTETNGRRVETHPNARRPAWPEAEFIVGNPPFIGKGATLRHALGDEYVDALWRAHPHMNESADFVMYWWDRAAELLTRHDTPLRRFGLVTTNSITQLFNRRVVERHLKDRSPKSIVFATADHPWTKATRDAAAVRIAMTVLEAGEAAGELSTVVSETGLDSDEPKISFDVKTGHINPDLTIGASISASRHLLSNGGLSCNGMMLAGRGFVLTEQEAAHFVSIDPGTVRLIKPYVNGGELVRHSLRRFVIDAFGMDAGELRNRHPELYQHMLATIGPERALNRRKTFRERWWVFGEPRRTFRPALDDLGRYIGTTETAKHRIFQFIAGDVVPDHMVIAIASDDAWLLAALSSRHHVTWSLASGGWLGVGNDPRYSKSRCFDPFPFPDPPDLVRERLRSAGEELDALRKRVLAEQPDLTMTGLYNVLEKVRAGAPLTDREDDVRQRGLVLILKELHETIDALTAEAYGWPADLADQEILVRLVALNAERLREERSGRVRWLRPDYQASRFGKVAAPTQSDLDMPEVVVPIDRGRPVFPKARHEQPLAVEALLMANGGAMDALSLAREFRGGGVRIEPRVAQVLLTLARYGHITALPDGRFIARRAA